MASIYDDTETGMKVDRDYLDDMSKEGAFFSSKENLYSRGQLVPSKEYKSNYDKICWGSLGVSQQDYDKEKKKKRSSDT